MSSSDVKNVALFLIAAFPGLCLAEYQVDCPKSVEYEISVSAPASGWNVGFRPVAGTASPSTAKREATYLEAVLYFEGDIDDAVELKGLTGKKYRGANARIIEMDMGRHYTAMCLYSNDLIQWKRLPLGLKRCVNVEKTPNTPHRAFCE